MAPRAKKQPTDEEVDGQASEAVEETKRLTALAYDNGILSKAKTLNARTLKPNKGGCGLWNTKDDYLCRDLWSDRFRVGCSASGR